MIKKDGEICSVSGPITMASVSQLLDEANSVLDGVSVIDFSQVSEVDSSAVSMLLQWMRKARTNQRELVFNNLPENLISLATVYGVMEFLVPQK
jgi:phospholipid transport system transporter-binding protein